MRAILDAHVAEPGLAVVEIAAADDATAFAIQDLLTERCAAAPADRQTGRPEIQASRASGRGSSSTYASAPTHSPIPSSVQTGRATGRNLKRIWAAHGAAPRPCPLRTQFFRREQERQR
nr:DUF6207 family protein [Streptomyces sp. RLB1-33]